MSVPLNQFFNTLLMWFEQSSIIFLFALGLNIDHYHHRVFLKKCAYALRGLEDLEK